MALKVKNLLLIAVFIYLPFQSGAWGLLGHRIIGEIAESYLNAKAKAAILKILGTESIAMASNWADFIKSDSTFNYVSAWHYIDLKTGLTPATIQEYLKKDTTADAYTKLAFLTSELKKKSLSQDKKLFYLRLLIHIAEDVHQPFHVREEAEGGNRINVLWFGERSNMHSVWDSKLIAYQTLSYTEYATAINHTTSAQRLSWQKQPLRQWIIDSYLLSEPLYSEITQNDQKLSFRYNFDHIQTLNDQMLKGGVHLAGLLNEIFGK